jgi:WhiB family redox-sensing transcriptional regulator
MPRHAPDTTTGSDTDWRQNAACKTLDGELWFPIGDNPTALAQAEQAKQICARCPVAVDCGTWAIQTRQPAGIWGGVDEKQRAAHLRKQGRSRVGKIGAQANDFDGRRPEIAHDMYWRHARGETINALATATGMTWWTVHALIAEGRAAA